ncbi:MAG: hypothetical protein II630_07690, partial [Bacteroidales bacterium]|nr:hypothetical protein [Bacteroidales bacterium]
LGASTLKYYEQTEYYVLTEQGYYKKAEVANEYCNKLYSEPGDKSCLFVFEVYDYCKGKWQLHGNLCETNE